MQQIHQCFQIFIKKYIFARFPAILFNNKTLTCTDRFAIMYITKKTNGGFKMKKVIAAIVNFIKEDTITPKIKPLVLPTEMNLQHRLF